MYYDLLTKIKNGQAVKKEKIKVSCSKFDEDVANALVKSRYISSVTKKGRNPKRVLEIELKYDDDKKGVIRGIRVLSKPSRHLYIGYNSIRKVKQGFGSLIISTSQGVMTGYEARKKKLGGEILFEIW